MIFAIMAFKLFIVMTQLEDHNLVVSLVWLFQYPNLRVVLFNKSQFPPDGRELANFNVLFIILIMKSIICSKMALIIFTLPCEVGNFHLLWERDLRSRWE
jgi:hypothetical protein